MEESLKILNEPRLSNSEIENIAKIVKIIEIENISEFKILVDLFINNKFNIEQGLCDAYLETIINKTHFFVEYLKSKVLEELNTQHPKEKDLFDKLLSNIEKGLDELTGETEESRAKFKKHIKEIFDKLFTKKENQ